MVVLPVRLLVLVEQRRVAGWVCPDTMGRHNNRGSSMYALYYGQGSTAGFQNGWRWCSQCDVLFWGEQQNNSICPGSSYYSILPLMGGPHVFGNPPTIYDVQFGNWSGDVQGNWRWCMYCQELYWGQDLSHSVCPANNPNGEGLGNHATGETDYYLQFG